MAPQPTPKNMEASCYICNCSTISPQGVPPHRIKDLARNAPKRIIFGPSLCEDGKYSKIASNAGASFSVVPSSFYGRERVEGGERRRHRSKERETQQSTICYYLRERDAVAAGREGVGGGERRCRRSRERERDTNNATINYL